MDKQFLIQLTEQLYKLTLLFPNKEPLRYKMRELADDILADLIIFFQNPQKFHQSEKPATAGISDWEGIVKAVSGNIEILDSFFEVAKAQTWVRQEEILHLQQEYSKLREEQENKKARKQESKSTEEVKNGKSEELNLSKRHQKIIEFLEQNKKAQVIDIQKILPQVTKRTVRRDFRDLLEQGLVERIGEKQETYYCLKHET